MNKKMLRSVLAAKGDTQTDLAEFLGVSNGTLSKKMNEKGSEFHKGEIMKIKKRYGLSHEDVDRIFFNEVVS